MPTPITIIGNTSSEVELRFTPSGTAVANLSVAVNNRRFNKNTNEWEDDGTDFYPVAVWQNNGAENVAQSITKGMRVVVVGQLKSRSYETREGEKRTVWEITADEVAPSLRYAEAQVRKIERQGGAGGHGWGQNQQQGRQGSGVDPWAVQDRPRGQSQEPPF